MPTGMLTAMLRRGALAWCMTLFVAAPMHAQQRPPRYGKVVGDTLFFREVSVSNGAITTKDGIAPIVLRHAATLGMTFVAADSATAWYEELLVEGGDPNGPHHPDPLSVLGQLFVLDFSDDGRVKTLATPAFPEEFSAITDLSKQFHDFFPRLPREGRLTLGTEWVDTLRVSESSSDGQYYRWVGAAHYIVTGDTTVGTHAALVVTMNQQIRVESGGPVAGRPGKAASVLSGEERGYFVFDPLLGVMLARQRDAELSGAFDIDGPTPFHATQTFRYTNFIEGLEEVVTN